MGESIRLCLAAKGIDFENEEVDKVQMKSDMDLYPYTQCPRYHSQVSSISDQTTAGATA